MANHVNHLTAQFYEWDCLGRGWLLGAGPVDLEPPYTPFFHRPPPAYIPSDDGARHTFLSRIASFFRPKPNVSAGNQIPAISYEPFPDTSDTAITVFQLHIPKAGHIPIELTLEFLRMLTFSGAPVSFELIATWKTIIVQLTCREEFAGYLCSQVRAYFPEVGIVEAPDAMVQIFDMQKTQLAVDFGLSEEFMRPIAEMKGSGADPLIGLFSLVEYLDEGEEVIVQTLFTGVINPWKCDILRSVTDGNQGPFFHDAPEMLPMAKRKTEGTLFAVAIRVFAQAATGHHAFRLLQRLAFSMETLSRSSGNALLPLSEDSYEQHDRIADILYRTSHRTGMLLNVGELATFVHVPMIDSKKLHGRLRKTKAAPGICTGGELVLGLNSHNGITVPATIGTMHRLKHTHIIGATGTGKTTLLKSMIAQDIERGNGIAVLDPHGDLIDAILGMIPQRRVTDVVVVDPSDSEFPVAFNILHAHSELEKIALSSDLVATFRRYSTSWGDQMNSVFENAVLAFLESTKGGTLADLRRFLIEKDFRQQFLSTVTDVGVKYYWTKEYPLLKSSSVGPILTRLDAFLRPKLIRNMVCQERSVPFDEILDQKKILLVKLSKGLIGIENSYLLGSFIVSKIHQAALARQTTTQRHDFYCYIDEFQHFITPSLEGILSGTRQYGLGLIVAHQNMQQLPKSDSDIGSSIVANAGTRICFRAGEQDAKKLAEAFSAFEPKDLQNLGVGEAVARIERPEYDFSLTVTPYDHDGTGMAEPPMIVAYSRSRYSAPRETVEASISHILNSQPEEPMQPSPVSRVYVRKTEDTKSKVSENERVAPPVTSEGVTSDAAASAIGIKEKTQHRYLQTLIKKMAEQRGYKATIEASLPDGSGKVDVLLERDTDTIACEVSVTTDATWETHNLQKCVAAGYGMVVACVSDKNVIATLQRKVHDKFTNEQQSRIKIFEPDMLFTYLDSIAIPEDAPATETTYKGYRVKVNYESLTNEQQKQKKDSVAKIVGESLKKMKR